jgi:hypothetical protein
MLGMLFVVGLPLLMILEGHLSRFAPAPVPHQTALAEGG